MQAVIFQRKHTTVNKALMALRDLSAITRGPFRLRNGTFVFEIQGCIVTADEVIELKQKGQLSPDEIAASVANTIGDQASGAQKGQR